MDKQKALPPLTQKITRKLASESADHHNVMKFYSQISRDESGAPKKWKMSNPVQINEGMIPISNAGTSNSRDGSAERKKSSNRAVNNVKKRGSSKDSPDRTSPRESSLENKDRNIKVPRGRKSLSADGRNRAENSVENGVRRETENKKRNRPKSLEINPKVLTNGDEDSFRSPHPLTPCNVAVKRRKGRPKETPPTLVAENPVEPVDDEADSSDINMETDTEIEPVVPKRKGRPTNTKKDKKAKTLKKPLALKAIDSGAVGKTLGSKIVKKTILKNYKKLPKSRRNAKTVSDKDSLLEESAVEQVSNTDLENTNSVLVNTDFVTNDSDVLPLRRGRNHGARNKQKLPSPEPPVSVTGIKVQDSEFVSHVPPPERRKAGRPPGAKNKVNLGYSPRRKPSVKVSSEHSAGGKAKSNSNLVTDSTPDIEEYSDIPTEMVSEDPFLMDTDEDDKITEPETIKEAIEEVIIKAEKRKTENIPAKKQNTLHTAHFKTKRGIKSLGKLKKEITNVPRVKKKRVLISHATNSDIMTSLAHLPPNDLRRKLQTNLLKKLNGKRMKSQMNSVSSDVEIPVNKQEEQTEINKINVGIEENSELSNSVENVCDDTEKIAIPLVDMEPVVDKNIDVDIQNLSALVEQKRINKSEIDLVSEQKKKTSRPRKSNSEQRDISKFSDSESVCSELSTQSLGSLKKLQDKQVYVLGEENADSDDNTVRTRQRFEIIPGKKRKRTLSGEFDLVDERQLRKQKKKVDQGDESADDSDTLPYEEKVETEKKSPNVKKKVLIAKRLQANKNKPPYRARMLRQSPFLNKSKKKFGFPRKRNVSKSSSDTELGAYGIDAQLSIDTEVEELEISHDVVPQVDVKDNEVFEQSVKDDNESFHELQDLITNDSNQTVDFELNPANIDSLDIRGEIKEDKECVKSSIPDIHEPTQIESDELDNDTEIICDDYEKAEKIEKIEETVSEVKDSSLNPVNNSLDTKVSLETNDFKESSETNEIVIKELLKEIVEGVLDFKTEKYEESVSVEKEIIVSEGKDNQILLDENVKNDDLNISETETAAMIQSTETTLSQTASVYPDGIARTPVAVRGGRGRRRRGRKPYKHLLLNNRSLHTTSIMHKKIPSRKTRKISPRGAHKISPEGAGLTRTFELRQKISRSPLDNIALKQSIEESEYYKNEAEKAVRKELKRAKRMSPSQDTEMAHTEDIAPETSEVIQDENAEMSAEETESRTEMLLKECKPCSVLLTDFIRQLQLAGRRVTSEDDTENDTEESLSDGSPLHVPEIHDQSYDEDLNLVGEETKSEEIGVDIKSNQEENEFSHKNTEIEKNQKVSVADSQPDNLASDQLTDLTIQESDKNISLNESKPSSVNKPVKSRNSKPSITAKKSVPKSSDLQYKKNLDTQNISQNFDTPKTAFQKPGPKSRRTSRKSVPSGPSRIKKPRNFTPPEIVPETQTARKTVPPLKIKLKGGLKSRRKTYMVETIIDDQANFKVVKKRSKNKSGSRSESETEKVSKSHHHHKRKSRTPDIEKKSKPSSVPSPMPAISESVKTLKPTDAYEANFLQFIQNSQEQSHSSSYYGNVKGKTQRQSPKNKAYKVDADGSLTVTASSSSRAETTTSTNTEKVVLSSNTEVTNTVVSVKDLIENNTNKKDAKELQFVCSYCDKMVFREKDYIVRHIKEMHPGEPIVYKELPYIITDSHIEYIDDKEHSNQENIFERMSDLYTDQDKAGKKVPDKTSAEADSTTEVESSPEATSVDKKQAGMETSIQQENVIDGDDESGGSLNLKIVEVVSLKDQINLLEDNGTVCAPEPPKQSAPVISPIQTPKPTELKVPHYPKISPKVPVQSQINSEKSFVEVAKKSAQHNVDLTVKKINQNTTGGKNVCTFKCNKCNVHAPMLAAMVAHLRNTHKDILRLFQCPYCRDMEAENESKIHDHIRLFHPTDNPNPPVALSEPAKRNLATIHVKIPENTKTGEGHALEKDIYMCLNCKTHKPSLETIYEHLEEAHSNVFVYVCPVCKTFKSRHENVVNNHLVHIHQQMFRDVNLSLAIDGNQFTRVSCLVKDKNKNLKSSSSSSSQSKSQSSVHTSKPSTQTSLHKQHTQVAGIINDVGLTLARRQQMPNQRQTNIVGQPVMPKSQQQIVSPVASLYQHLYQTSVQSSLAIPTHSHTKPSPLSPLTVNTNNTSSAPPPPQNPSPQARPPSAPAPKRKKNLLESIQQLTLQKQKEQQGLLQSSSKATTSSSSVGTPSTSSLPPPLLCGPPPLIRYDQVEKAPPTYSAAMASLAARVPGAASGQSSLEGRSKSPAVSQSQIPPRQIQSSLFDTSDPETFKPVKRSPVLNVPVVPRSKFTPGLASKSPSPQKQNSSSGALDLSKASPSPSPQPPKMQSPPPASSANIAKTTSKPYQVSPEGINPDIFKVFNLKPSSSSSQPSIRPTGTIMQASLSPLVAAQHVLPQQVRPNTSSTLAYRPAIPHVSATAQVPQLMNMGAIIGNIMVPITSLPQNFQAVPGMGQIQGLPTQLVQMTMAQPLLNQTMPISATTQITAPVLTSSKSSTAANNNSQSGSQPLTNLNLPMFKCPYCPKVIPLSLAQVQPHIETQHPGSSIVFTQLENK